MLTLRVFETNEDGFEVMVPLFENEEGEKVFGVEAQGFYVVAMIQEETETEITGRTDTFLTGEGNLLFLGQALMTDEVAPLALKAAELEKKLMGAKKN